MNDSEDVRPSSGLAAVLIPFATSFAALLVGAAVGGVVGWVAHAPATIEIARAPTAAELAAACAPQIAEKAAEVEEARGRVSSLTKAVEEREARVTQLETEMNQRAERGRQVTAELTAAKAELESLRAQLASALADKARLETELTETQEALEDQTRATEVAQDDALVNKWHRFLNDAQLEICEKGNRKKLGACRETVEATLGRNDIRSAFEHCVRSGQATPSVRELEKDATVPSFSKTLNEEDKIVKGWIVQLCDPTLPEANDLAP